MASCEDVDELLSAALDGELPFEANATVTAHVSACVRCAEEQQALAEMRSLLRALPTRQTPEAVRAHLVTAARVRGAVSRPRQLAVASALLAAVIAGATVGAAASPDPGAPVPVDQLVTEHLATSGPAPESPSVQR